jgi:predicted transcriptional regulator
MTATSPVKVSAETDQLLTEASHFLARSKKDIVDAAVRDYVDAKRDEINAGIRDSLSRLDGTRAAVISEISGLSRKQLEELGGVPEE